MEQEKEAIVVDVEEYFLAKQCEVDLAHIDAQIKSLLLDKERLLYDYQQIMNKSGSPEEDEKPEEVKPKKLKKTNDQSSKNDAEV